MSAYPLERNMAQRLRKELIAIRTDPPTPNCQAGPIDEQNIFHWQATLLAPEDTPYRGGIFFLDIDIPTNYPIKPPKVKFTTPVFHPNIDPTGKICLDMLTESWVPIFNISKVILQIYSLFQSPNPDSSLNPEAANLYKTDREAFNRQAAQWTQQYASGGL
ncbi:putative Ubiquitin-conjugating enzyme E2 D2B [Paratrimastix pyriformis]|uniref:Ubiquitin-conjugating enzyme E2 D2B n=1 Tax=Paratrimastix pyriformis TaxID=342808 RepID=A0ABQ8UQ58_9EUKA|nr:putative Ubiquitin-conjugating enzyme E2 D2B [Paratrimastix pyriformis]